MASQGAPHNYAAVLSAPPFFLLPGINPASSLSTQTEQIDTLNTLLLQTIDANFARVHQIITTKILPEVKRFAIASEPTRKTAEFWHHFYTSAAGTRLLAPAGAGEESEITMSSMSMASAEPTAYHERTISVEGSFNMSAFDPPGVSSTPLPKHRDPSWDISEVGSPYDQVDRDLSQSIRINREDSSSTNNSNISTPSVLAGYTSQTAAYNFDASTGTVETPDLPQYLPSIPNRRDVSAIPSESEASQSHATLPPEFKSYAHDSVFRQRDLSDSTASIPMPRSLEASRASSTTLQRSTATQLHNSVFSTRSARTAMDDSDDEIDAGATPRAPQQTLPQPQKHQPKEETPRRPRPSHHLIDLTNTPLNIAQFSRNFDNSRPSSTASVSTSAAIRPEPAAAVRPAQPPMRDLFEDSEDDDDLGKIPFSLPETMTRKFAFQLPGRAGAAYAESRAALTPKKPSADDIKLKATTHELGNLIADMTADLSPSPAKLPDDFNRRYSVMPGELGRKLFDTSASSVASSSSIPNVFAPAPKQNVFAPSGQTAYAENSPFNPDTYAPRPSRAPRRSVANTSWGSDLQTAHDSPGRAMSDDDDGDDDDLEDSFDDDMDGNGAGFNHQQAAVAGFAFDDDSYMSDEMDYTRRGGDGARGSRAGSEFTDTHVHGGGQQRGNEMHSEVFGRPSGGRGQFALHQQDEMLTYHGGRLEDALQPGTPLGGLEGDISSLGAKR